MDGYQLKKILDNIIETAYPQSTEEELRNYRRYYIQLVDKTYKSKNGDYLYSTRKLRVFSTKKRAADHIVKTSIHELSHHIDYCRRGTSDHKKPFYEVYRRLLYAGIEIGIFSKEDFMEGIRDSSDYNKVCKMLSEYSGSAGVYKEGQIRVNVKNAYTIKEKLKEKKFRFDSITKDWYMEAPEIKRDAISDFLDGLGADYEITTPNNISFRREMPMPDKGTRNSA